MHRRTFLCAAIASACAVGARAQPASFPTRPIRYVIPVAAGGADMIGRTVTERWGKVLGQTFVVENLGGGGVIACQTVKRAAADGYTLLQGYVATHGTSPATRKVPYDAEKDFTPIGMIGATPNVLIVNAAQVPAQTLSERLAYLRQRPGQLNYGSAGPGSLTHLTMELFKQQVGAFIVHIPYRGIAPAFNDLLAGQTQMMFPGLAAALPHIRSGRVRALAVTGTSRHPLLPQTPTLIEAGFKGFDAMQWYGVHGPAGIAAPIVARLNETLNEALQQPDLREKLSGEAVQPMPMTPQQFAAFVRADLQRWRQLAHERKISLDE